MSGRKTHAQNIMELIDKRVRSILRNSVPSNNITSASGEGNIRTSANPFENASFITRDDHRGHGHGDLPDSVPIFNLDSSVIPSGDKAHDLGSLTSRWRALFVDKIILSSPEISFGIDADFLLKNIAFKHYSSGVLVYGYGNHRVKNQNGVRLYPNTASIKIPRPIPYSNTGNALSIGSWMVNPWYSREIIMDSTGIGSRRNCCSNASPLNPGVESEILDTGNPQCVYVLFRNYLTYPVFVGVAVTY